MAMPNYGDKKRPPLWAGCFTLLARSHCTVGVLMVPSNQDSMDLRHERVHHLANQSPSHRLDFVALQSSYETLINK